MVRTLCSHCRGPGFDSWSGNEGSQKPGGLAKKKERKKERKKAACTGLLRAAMTLSAGLGSEDKQLIQANAMSSLLNGVLLTEVCRLMGFCAI